MSVDARPVRSEKTHFRDRAHRGYVRLAVRAVARMP
jgi:hypothetical protein